MRQYQEILRTAVPESYQCEIFRVPISLFDLITRAAVTPQCNEIDLQFLNLVGASIYRKPIAQSGGRGITCGSTDRTAIESHFVDDPGGAATLGRSG